MGSPINALSRRDFLKLASYGVLGLALPDFSPKSLVQPFDTDLQGRVTEKSLWTYNEPSAQSKRVEIYWRDLVIPLSGAAISEDEEAYNRVWYEVEN
jgi:hypothetical protein